MKNELLKEFKILLVEDEQNLAKLLKDAIAEHFYSFTIAANGKEGLEIFERISPDIVITDIMMPDMTGLEMAQILRKKYPNLPIIILSAYSEKEKLLHAIDVGVVKYFIKPFDPDELLEYISSISQKIGSKLYHLEENYLFNKTSKRLYQNGKYIPLTKREATFFSFVLESYDNIANTESLIKYLWDDEVSHDRLRTFIRRLRNKTSKNLITTIKNQGYSIRTL